MRPTNPKIAKGEGRSFSLTLFSNEIIISFRQDFLGLPIHCFLGLVQ
jgi:hypothetical protein